MVAIQITCGCHMCIAKGPWRWPSTAHHGPDRAGGNLLFARVRSRVDTTLLCAARDQELPPHVPVDLLAQRRKHCTGTQCTGFGTTACAHPPLHLAEETCPDLRSTAQMGRSGRLGPSQPFSSPMPVCCRYDVWCHTQGMERDGALALVLPGWQTHFSGCRSMS